MWEAKEKCDHMIMWPNTYMGQQNKNKINLQFIIWIFSKMIAYNTIYEIKIIIGI